MHSTAHSLDSLQMQYRVAVGFALRLRYARKRREEQDPDKTGRGKDSSPRAVFAQFDEWSE